MRTFSRSDNTQTTDCSDAQLHIITSAAGTAETKFIVLGPFLVKNMLSSDSESKESSHILTQQMALARALRLTPHGTTFSRSFWLT